MHADVAMVVAKTVAKAAISVNKFFFFIIIPSFQFRVTTIFNYMLLVYSMITI